MGDMSERLKREKLKRLSCVNRVTSKKEEREMGFTGPHSKVRKKFKPPRKVLRDCNTDYHASVPRKLRSAMMKRNQESVSPPFEVRLAGDEGNKKSRINQQDDSEGSCIHCNVAVITKEEEEVAETLFALAKSKPEPSEEGEGPCCAIEDSSELEKEESARDTLEATYSIEPSASLMCQHVTPKPLSCGSFSCNSESEPSLRTNWKELALEGTTANEKKAENKNIGLLLPGLSSTQSLGDDVKRPSMNPAWMGLTGSKTLITDKDVRDPIFRNKSWKRCLAHAHISCLIKALQTAAKMNNSLEQPHHQSVKNDRQVKESHLSKTIFGNDNGGSAVGKDENEIENAILLHKSLLQDQHQASPTSTLQSSSKQVGKRFDFLSLLTGGGGAEAIKTVSKTATLMEPLTQFHIPYLQSVALNRTNLPLSMHQSRYSTPHTGHHPSTTAKQVQMQQQYPLTNPISDPSQWANNASLPAQHLQRIWAAQFASQYQPVGLPNRRNGKQDAPTPIAYTQNH